MTAERVSPIRDDVPDLEACLRLGINPNDPKAPRYGDPKQKTEEEDIMGTKKKKTNGHAKKNGNGVKVRERVSRATYKRELQVPANAKEIAGAASAMAVEVRKREALLSERRETMAEFRESLTGVDQRLADLATTVEKGTKKAEVKVTEYLVVETNEIEVVREDTGEVIETRTATADDRQENLLPKEPPALPEGETVDPSFDEADAE